MHLSKPFILLLLLFLMLPITAAAQQQGMSSNVHRIVDAANDKMESGDPEGAIRELNAIVRRGGLNDYEKAVIQQMLGFAHVHRNDSASAREAFEQALSIGTLPEGVTEGVRMSLAQACMDLEDFNCARNNVNRAIEAGDKPNPEFLAVAAYLHYELEEYETAERHILRAIAISEDPIENWYQILLAIYRAEEAWARSESVLREVIMRYPDRGNYWQFLSYVLFAQDKMHEALATLMLSWRLDLVEGEELERIVGFHANLGIPEKAARLLEQWLETDTIEGTTERVSMLGRLWLMSRERAKAMDQLARAADNTTDGEIDLLLGKLHYEDQRWEQSMQHLETALDKDGLSENEVAEAQLLLGISAYHSGRRDTATLAFEAAQRTPRYEDHARYWLNRIEEEAGS